MLVRFLRDESRAIAIEYGLIAVGISPMAAVNRLGPKLSTKFASINSSLTGGAAGSLAPN
ncbi:Flp family type IVb pilin [Bradyrhizobium lablabi]|uniref:Flp family type IVb pilin n=1 Tax=Bradyrhizobium lablabi TaxID=722472 RepID=UPI0009EBD54E